jgi:hypothetical protein
MRVYGFVLGLALLSLGPLAYVMGWFVGLWQRRHALWVTYGFFLLTGRERILAKRRRPLAWRITHQPPLPGPHSLGSSLVVFGPDGTLITEEEDTAMKAKAFPGFFLVEGLSTVTPVATDDGTVRDCESLDRLGA